MPISPETINDLHETNESVYHRRVTGFQIDQWKRMQYYIKGLQEWKAKEVEKASGYVHFDIETTVSVQLGKATMELRRELEEVMGKLNFERMRIDRAINDFAKQFSSTVPV